MKKYWTKQFKDGFVFMELLLVLLIILFLCYKAFNFYFKKSPFNKETEKSLSEQGIDTQNYEKILDSSREKVQGINKQLMNRQNELENITQSK